ncbi:MAG: carbohydrate binding family 9 domain-containing protein [Acidobacteria bacterium]|nr:carbohydrate binding family 9 domain-containing protein [Acidobacteriota bacterium]
MPFRPGVPHAVLLALAAVSPLFAQPSAAPPPSIAAHRTATPIQVDGRLDEAVYASTTPVSDFVQQEPDEFKPATEKTDAWVFFDDNNIYVSARCFESHPERRVANEMRRDTSQLRQNDTFLVLFDTFHDRRNGYLFYANAIGGLADGQVTDEGPPNMDWNTVWNVRTANFEGGWTIEMAIPFKSLRYLPGREQTWGINLRRVVRWKNEWSYLAQVPRALTTFRGVLKVSSAGTLTGLEAPGRTRNLEVKPFTLGNVATDRTVTPTVDNDTTLRGGVDVKYGVTQNLAADLTVNTDFAQVEVDEQQVNLTRFNLFFPEKRDFFLEGAGTFAFAGRASAGLAAGSGDTPYLFFTRRIGLDGARQVPLRVGGRMSGKVGATTVGVLNVQTGEDAVANADSTNFTVLRAKRDILRRSSIGGMLTHRTSTPGKLGANTGLGLDATFSFYQNLRIDSYVAATRSEGREGDDLSYRGFFDYNADRYGVQVERLEVQPNFLPEAGFLRRTDMRRNFALLRFSPRPRRIPHLRKITAQASLNYVTNTGDRLDTREQVGQFQTEFTNSDILSVSYTDSFDRLVRPFAIAPGIRIPVGGYNFATTQVSYTGGQQRRYSGALVYEGGPFYSGERHSIALNAARMEVTPQFSAEPSVSVNWVDLKEGSFRTTVARLRGTYTMTPRMYVSGIVQYNSTSTSFGSNLRFRWEYRPGSEVFVVYTDDYDTEARPGMTPLRNRAFVVKVNRLFRP